MDEGSRSDAPTGQTPPRKPSTPKALLAQGAGALLWGAFFSVTPIYDLLLPGIILWLPVLIWRERRRSAKHGFLGGFVLRAAAAALVMTAAVLFPAKHEDLLRVQELPGPRVTLTFLSTQRPFSCQESLPETEIVLPSAQPTLREAIGAMEAQGKVDCQILRCGNGVTLLWGAYIMGVAVHHRS